MTVPPTYEVCRAYQEKERAETAIGEARNIWNKAEKKYTQEWQDAFNRALADSGLRPCSYCDRIVIATTLREAWELYSKSDNYGPVFAHTATKHMACSACVQKLSTPKEARSFDAMFEHDNSDRLGAAAIDALIPLLGLSPKQPWKEA